MSPRPSHPRGLARFVGPLEARVLERLWQNHPATAKEVWLDIKGKYPLAYTTILTILMRLKAKGLLTAGKRRQALLFSPTSDRATFIHQRLQTFLAELADDFPDDFTTITKDLRGSRRERA